MPLFCFEIIEMEYRCNILAPYCLVWSDVKFSEEGQGIENHRQQL